MKQIERFRGCLLGLAAGDAVGTTLEFRQPGTFDPIDDMIGGGPFRLNPGEWTDDTSMALCLAESLIERNGFDPVDQLERYVRWWTQGHLSSTGHCFDIGNTVSDALSRFTQTRDPYGGSTGEWSAGNGSIMRLAPIPMFFSANPCEAIERSADSSRTTHGALAAVDAARYFGGLLVGAVNGAGKEELLSDGYCPVSGYWDQNPLIAAISKVASGSFKRRSPPEIVGSGYVVRSLEAALWAFHNSEDFRQGCLLAVNLGDDADTTAAIYGQLAEAYYGEQGIPASWLGKLAMRATIEAFAGAVFERAQADGD